MARKLSFLLRIIVARDPRLIALDSPTESQTFHYARTVLDLLLRSKAENKVLFIGGGIANFTNVASTFKGVIRALREVCSSSISPRQQPTH